MAEPRRGEIYYVQIPGEPHPRPAVIVSVDSRNRAANDVIVVPLTTTLRPMPTHVLLNAGEGGLRRASMAKCEQITTLPKTELRRGPLGRRISSAAIHAVEQAIMRAVGIRRA